jgi:Janus/Ocnus family (Ocnus)
MILESENSGDILLSIPDIKINEKRAAQPMKFIIATIEYRNKKKLIIRATDAFSADSQYAIQHKTISHELAKELQNLSTDARFDIDGGGWMILENGEKRIWKWGASNAYGYANDADVKKLFIKNYLDYDVIIVEHLPMYSKVKGIFFDMEMGKYNKQILEDIKRIVLN